MISRAAAPPNLGACGAPSDISSPEQGAPVQTQQDFETIPLGDADTGQQILPRPGSHMLALVDPGGRMIDRVRFTVR